MKLCCCQDTALENVDAEFEGADTIAAAGRLRALMVHSFTTVAEGEY